MRQHSILFIALMLLSSVAFPQSAERISSFAGCYRVVSVTRNPPDPGAQFFAPQLTFTNQLVGDGWFMISTSEREMNRRDRWYWKPIGKNRINVDFSWGLGGYKGSFKRDSQDSLIGRVKNYCDYKCSNTEIATVKMQKTECEAPKK